MQRINLFPAPGFLHGITGNAENTVANGEMTVKQGADNACSAITVPNVGRDELVLSIESRGNGDMQIFDTDWKILNRTCVRDQADWTVENLRFTPTPGKSIVIGFYPNGGDLIVRRPQLELASTYDAAVRGGLPGFFTGDTMPRA